MPWDIFKWAYEVNGLDGNQRSVLVYLSMRANQDNYCWPSIADMVKKTSLSESTVHRSLSRLIELGLITKRQRFRKNGSQSSNSYTLHMRMDIHMSEDGISMNVPNRPCGTHQAVPHETPQANQLTPLLNSHSELPKKIKKLSLIDVSNENVETPIVDSRLGCGNETECIQSDTPIHTNTETPTPKKDEAKDTTCGGHAAAREAKTAKVWAMYEKKFEKRYGSKPLRNAKVNSLLCQLIDQVGKDIAPSIVSYYLYLDDEFYVRQMHPVYYLVRDMQALYVKHNQALEENKRQQQIHERELENEKRHREKVQAADEMFKRHFQERLKELREQS